jgi:glycosyltransferase involved in cell wall biosynthesis
MKISVVMPTLNDGVYIGPAIQSVLGQDWGELELLIQDGGSTDGTDRIVEEIGDERVDFVSGADRGQSHATNIGIARATGEWILWLNADDLLAPRAFADAAEALVPEHDFVFGDFAYIDGAGRVMRRISSAPSLSRRRLLTHGNYLFSGTVFFRRSLFETWGGLDERLHYAMDYDFYLRVADHVTAFHCPTELAYFRLHESSNTSTHPWSVLRETAKVRHAHGAFSGDTLVPAAWSQAKQAIDALTRPVRRRLGMRAA